MVTEAALLTFRLWTRPNWGMDKVRMPGQDVMAALTPEEQDALVRVSSKTARGAGRARPK